MRRPFRVILGVCAVAGVPLISGAIAAASPAAADPAGITLSGNQFLRGGQPFVPHGFNSIALLNSPWCTSPVTQAAAASFSPAELQLAQSAWNANTLRFQVSQPVLAGPNGVAYAQQIDAAVKTALSSGFVVDVSMQDQSRACGPAEPLPGPETEAAWSTLISNTGLRTYPDVMLELFNEPQNSPATTRATDPRQSTWVDWLSGGRKIGPGNGWAAYVPVGHQALVDFLRTVLNVPNILIVDGASHAAHLEGMPLLHDPGPTHQIAYAVHPYYYTDDQPNWDLRWGYLAPANALIATEWNYTASSCGSTAQRMAPKLLTYLRRTVNIGVLGHALDDYTGALVVDGTLQPTLCATASPGGGQDFLQDYLATFDPAAADLPTGNPLPPGAPTGLAASYGSNQIRLTWSPAQDPDGTVAGYDVYRNGILVTTTAFPSYTDARIKEATPYTYTVDAFDTTGIGSALSAPLVATAPDDQPPSMPTGVKLTRAAKSITIAWAACTDNVAVTGYRVYRNAAPIATSTTRSFTDTAVVQANTYQYKVVALDKAGNASVPSSGRTIVFPDTTKPSAPTMLTLTPAKASITLRWAASTDNVAVTAYRVYRGSTLIATVAGPTLSYTNTGLKSGTSYSYHLVAVDAAGNASAAGATVSAKAK